MVDGKKRHRISLVDCQPFQRFEENFGRVQREFFLGPVWPDDELRFRAARHVFLKYSVRIVQVGDNDCEAGEIIRQRLVEGAVPGEETGERAGVNRANLVYRSASECQLRDVRIAQHLQMRLGKLPPQRREHRQRQNEVANRAAADNENFAVVPIHGLKSIVSAF